MYIKIKLDKKGKLPSYTDGTPAGMDCYASDHVFIKAHKRELVPLGFACEIPNGWSLVTYPRSGYTKRGIDVAIGTIDSDYRGMVYANVINNTDEDHWIDTGSKICQIKAERVEKINLELVDELSQTTRGDQGFGHSGD